jgi:diaminopimelate epimerase
LGNNVQLQFTKLHGAGNDFIVVDDFAEQIELSAEQVEALCDRHFGIGADGVILVRPSKRSGCVAYMHYINADGSLAEMCGNGVRCFAKFLVDKGFVDIAAGSFVVDTLAGERAISFTVDAANTLTSATVDMGEPVFAPACIPTTLSATQTVNGEPAVVQAVINGAQRNLPVTCVNMGNPHAVVFLEYLDSATAQAFAHDPLNFDIEPPGVFLESNLACFPQKTNAEFAAVIAPNKLRMRVYERGVGETLACGTGACATAVAAALLELVDRSKPVAVELLGGTLTIIWRDNNHVLMTGPAQTVYKGSVAL